MRGDDRLTPVITEVWPELPEGSVLRGVRAARAKMLIDTAGRMFRTGLFNPAVVIGGEELGRELAGLPFADFEPAGKGDLHTGRALARVVAERSLKRVMAFGGGSCFLLSEGELAEICARTRRGFFVTNNPFSSDFVSFCSGDAAPFFGSIPERDNDFAFFLRIDAGLSPELLPLSAGTAFDADLPVDFALLERVAGRGTGTYGFLRGGPFSSIDPEPVLDVLSKRGMETLLWGRINPAVASVMEAGVAGRLRTVSEERGMKTRGRSRGTVFGDLSDPAVLRGFAASFGRLCDAGIIDTRPVFSAFGCCGEDALFSDLGMHERIINPFVRSFSEIVRGTGRPVLFGGHSLVSGGLLVMAGILRERR